MKKMILYYDCIRVECFTSPLFGCDVVTSYILKDNVSFFDFLKNKLSSDDFHVTYIKNGKEVL